MFVVKTWYKKEIMFKKKTVIKNKTERRTSQLLQFYQDDVVVGRPLMSC